MSAPVNSVALNLEAQLGAVARERDELRAALASTADELEEWRFTNRIDELQRENDRLRASQQGAGELPQDERAALLKALKPFADIADLYPSMNTDDSHSVLYYEVPESHKLRLGHCRAAKSIMSAIAQRAASVPAEAVRVERHYPRVATAEVLEAFARKRGFKTAAQAIAAATVPQDIGRDAALEMKKAIIAVISYGHSHSEAPTAKFAKELLGAIERDDRVAKALATPPANVAQAAPKD